MEIINMGFFFNPCKSFFLHECESWRSPFKMKLAFHWKKVLVSWERDKIDMLLATWYSAHGCRSPWLSCQGWGMSGLRGKGWGKGNPKDRLSEVAKVYALHAELKTQESKSLQESQYFQFFSQSLRELSCIFLHKSPPKIFGFLFPDAL